MSKFSWQHWSIRTRVLLATLTPVLYLFCSVVGYSYHSRLQETDDELRERARIVATALSESLEVNVTAKNISGINLSINALAQSDRSIYRISVLDAQKREISQVTSYHADRPQAHAIEVPIKKNLIWVSLLNSASDSTAQSNPNAVASKSPTTVYETQKS